MDDDEDEKPRGTLDPVVVVSRDTWGALPAKSPPLPFDLPIINVVVHWSADTDQCETTEECSRIMQDLQKNHMEEKGLDDIAYNFVIGGDGKAYAGRGWEGGTPNPLVYPQYEPSKRIDIAYMGRDWSRTTIPWEMLKAALQVLSAGVDAKLLDEEYNAAEIPEEIAEE